MKSKNKLTIFALSIAMITLTGCKENKEQSNDDALSKLSLSSIDKKEKKEQPKQEQTAPQAQISAPSAVATGSGSTSTKRASNYPRNDASISNQVAIQEIEKGNPYTSIVSEVEGFRARPYSDVGQGFAVGNGWNMSFQSPKNNRAWAQQAGIAEPMIKNIVALSGRMQGATPTGIEITPTQATAVAMAMKPTFEQPAIKLFGQSTWNKLQEHQKAVLIYHIEKVGPGGAARYKGLIKAVQDYAIKPSDAKAQEVVSHITYGYKIKYPDGSFKQMQDHRSQLYMGALFVDPQQYRYLLGKATAPKGFASTAKTAGFNIDTSKPVESQVQSQDKFHAEIELLADQGFVPDVKQEIDGKTISYSMALPEQEKPATPKPQPKPQAQAPMVETAPPKAEPQDPSVPQGCKKMMSGNVPYLSCTAEALSRMNKGQ